VPAASVALSRRPAMKFGLTARSLYHFAVAKEDAPNSSMGSKFELAARALQCNLLKNNMQPNSAIFKICKRRLLQMIICASMHEKD
jgi:hypothetical protein